MSRKITSFCVVLLLALTSVSAARRHLNSISEVEDVHRDEYTNVLELLRWFANTVDICNNVIRLTFDPNRGYGSHHYGNYENLLDPVPWGFKYYTVGNIHKDTSESLPSYVQDSKRRTSGWNRARIIFSANENQQINRVFITQHDDSSDDTSYNPDYTFQVTVNLLQEFRRGHYTHGHQSGSYRNTVYEQRYTPQAHTGNDGMGFLWKFCFIVLLFICALIILSLPAQKGKY